jgi:hypothetical protein
VVATVATSLVEITVAMVSNVDAATANTVDAATANTVDVATANTVVAAATTVDLERTMTALLRKLRRSS